MELNIIERARRYIAKCPPAISGERGHDATFHVAAVLWNGFGLSEAETLGLIGEYNERCLPRWSEAELIHKVRSAANAQHSDPRGFLVGNGECGMRSAESRGHLTLPSPPAERAPKPAFAPEILKRVARKASAIEDVVGFIKERSPVVVDRQDSASFLRRVYGFGSGEKVLLFSKMESPGQMVWEADRSDVIQAGHLPAGPEGVWFLPQPVDGEYHPNPRLGGKLSRRSEESVTAWRFAVLESDEADADDWLRCLIQMPLRIVSICESGGRSIHALVRVDAASKANWDRMVGGIKPVLITLGADRGALSAVRLTRLPQATRGDRVQRLLYLNTAPDGTPIIQMRSGEWRDLP